MNNHDDANSDMRAANLSADADLAGWNLTRRELLRYGLVGAAGLLLSGRVGLRRLSAAQQAGAAINARPKAKSVIQIWMWGGPSHLDTFDPKPNAGNDYTGPLNHPIATNVDGIMIGESLPLLAKQADKYAIIRSMTHGINGHETAAYLVQTGHVPGGNIAYPGAGAVVSLFKGYDAGYTGLIPPYIVLTQLQGRFSESGFLGNRYKPFATGGNPASTPFAVEGVVAANITEKRQKDRRKLMEQLNTLQNDMKDDPLVKASQQAREQAYEVILGDAGKVFDLSQETNEMRDRYGRNTFGQSCLAARRLIEKGVPYVTINAPGWDTHKQHFQEMRRKLPEMDKGMSTLLQDLSDRGLLDTTVVWWGGEFGRTPKVQWEPPWNGGRGHHGKVFSHVVAGGGFKGGCVVGESDEKGEDVKDRPVYPCDLIAAIYERLGIDLNAKMPNPMGLEMRVSPTIGDGVKTGGKLKEIL